MASFYNLVSAWDLSSVSFITINNINKYHKAFNAEQLYRTYDYLDSSGKVFEYTKNIFKDEYKIAVREKLTGAFGYANISRATLFQEEKYMNLWVALESLARTRMYPDIISNVKQTVPAAMSLRYIYRIVRIYVEDCIRCKVEFDFPNHYIDMKQDSKQKMVKETIEVFRTPTLYDILLQKSEVNSLLKYRTESVYKILIDITSDIRTALFFACCKWKRAEAFSHWEPLDKEDIARADSRPEVAKLGGDSRYGMIFKARSIVAQLSRQKSKIFIMN